MSVLGRGALLVALAAPLLLSARPSGQAVPAEIPIGLEWRNVGPAVTGTRIVDLAVVERDPGVIYAATASSGLWKTTNAGTTWAPVFERERTVSLGGVAVSQSDPSVVWVATGEPNMRNMRSTSRGDGVYRSLDAGATWQHMGLAEAQHMGRIVIHPTDPDTVFASVMGSMWQNDPAKKAVRGLWKTTDAGVTWRNVLPAGEHAGVVDVAFDPAQPRILYAAAWHRERRDWSWINLGAEGGIYRSTDAGETWMRLTAGLPSGPVGRIGLSVCRSRPSTVYAVIEGPEGGVYRSLNGGATWERRNEMSAASMYYGQVRCDPTDSGRVHVLQTQLSTSDDGGATFHTDLPGRGVHVDHHALWINPRDTRHLLLGNDGGIYQSRDRGETWLFHGQMATTQFYAVAVDMREPFYYVYGGTQDNNSLGGPSATIHTDGIVSGDWYVTTGGDGFALQIDPTDPSVVFTESQYGVLVRFNPFTGERQRIQPQAPEGGNYRWNWNAPIRLSTHDPKTLYFGAQFVFRSRDRGETWETISPDLTRRIEIDPEFRISDYGTLSWIHESPRRQGWLATGSDDGLVQISQDFGENWRVTTPMPGVPERAQIRRVLFSAHDDETIYVAPAAHEDDDYRPYLLKSTNLGQTWTPIVGDLDTRSHVFSLAEDPVNPGLLYAGTEFGVFVTLDGGAHWRSLQLNLPTVPVHDIVIHPREGDVVLGTHGRGIWILDSARALQGLTPDVAARAGAMFTPRPPRPATRFDRGRSSQGDTLFRAPNPHDGAYLDYYVNPSAIGPVSIEIADASGTVVRRFDIEAERAMGVQRLVWDLRAETTTAGARGRGGRGAGGQAGGGRAGRGGGGALVPAGSYEVRLRIGDEVFRSTVTVPS